MTPEGRVKDRIDRALKELRDERHVPIYWHKPVQNGMGAPTLDYIGCCAGFYFAIEAKAPDGKPTPRQEQTMEQIRVAQGSPFVIRNDIELADFVCWCTLCVELHGHMNRVTEIN